ncbi:unnamed protein product [Lampetra fluviatilis]
MGRAAGVEEEAAAGATEDGATRPETSHQVRTDPPDPATFPRGRGPSKVLQSTRDGDWHLGGLCDAATTKPFSRRPICGLATTKRRSRPHVPLTSPHMNTPARIPPPPIELEEEDT